MLAKKPLYGLSTLFVVLSLVLSACSALPSAIPNTGGMQQSVGQGEGEVDIIAWAGYVERGATDPNYDWVTTFEKDTGCKVNVKVAATSDEMVALMNDGGFDLVTASGDASNRLISGHTVQEININLIPSWKNVDPGFRMPPGIR